MKPEYRTRWKTEISKLTKPLKKPKDLLSRAMASEDVVDAAVIGGVEVTDILAGKIAESQIPSNVLDAFHAQFPQYGASFVEAVNRFGGHPEQLVGLVNGVKGKLFEIDYLDWLNHGHLPTGFVAEMAQHANNPGWDIAIHDGHGHLAELLQLKATESLGYVREAIAAHPDIDVVVPHELYERVAEHPDVISHLANGHETLSHLNGHVADAVGHAEAAGAVGHFPVVGPAVVIGIVAFSNWQRYRNGKVSADDALRNVGERGILAMLSTASGWAMTVAGFEPFIALPTAMTVRLFGGQLFHNRRRRELLEKHIATVCESRRHLECQLLRPLLEAIAD